RCESARCPPPLGSVCSQDEEKHNKKWVSLHQVYDKPHHHRSQPTTHLILVQTLKRTLLQLAILRLERLVEHLENLGPQRGDVVTRRQVSHATHAQRHHTVQTLVTRKLLQRRIGHVRNGVHIVEEGHVLRVGGLDGEQWRVQCVAKDVAVQQANLHA